MTGSTGALRAFTAVLSLLAAGSVHAQPSPTTDIGETEDESSALPWRSTSLTFSQSLNVNAFDRSAQLSYNPTYSWTFILDLHWYLAKKTHLNLDQRMFFEWTDSDTTLYAQRAMLSDSVFGIDTELYSFSPADGTDLAFNGGFHLIAPTSIASRAATMTIGGRIRAGASLALKHVLSGLNFAVQGRYTHRFLRHNAVEVDQPFPCSPGSTTAANCALIADSGDPTRSYFLGDAASPVADAIAMVATASLQLNDRFSLDLLVWLTWAKASSLTPASITTATGQVVGLPDRSLTHWRNDRYLVLGASWSVNDWLNLGLSLIDYFPEKDIDGTNRSIANPLDLMIGLSTSIVFDKLYLNTQGRKPRPEHAKLWLPVL